MRLHTSENLTSSNRSRSPVVAYPLEIPRQSAVAAAAAAIAVVLRRKKESTESVREKTAFFFDANALYRWRRSKRRQRPPAGWPDNRVVAELIYMRVNHGFDSRPRFQRIKEESTAVRVRAINSTVTSRTNVLLFSFFFLLHFSPLLGARISRLSRRFPRDTFRFPITTRVEDADPLSIELYIFHLYPAAFILISDVNEANSPLIFRFDIRTQMHCVQEMIYFLMRIP